MPSANISRTHFAHSFEIGILDVARGPPEPLSCLVSPQLGGMPQNNLGSAKPWLTAQQRLVRVRSG
jgi:hypothetical protein